MSKSNINNYDKKWEKYNILFKEYNKILKNKIGKIDFYDLLLVRNFKGGGAVISNSINDTNKKLKKYNELFLLVNKDNENNKQIAKKLMDLVNSKDTKISGFKSSYLSALMSLMFPNTYPIMDKYVLYGIGILKEYKKDQQNKMNKENYIKLIDFLKEEEKMTLRELDKVYFIKGKRKEKELKDEVNL